MSDQISGSTDPKNVYIPPEAPQVASETANQILLKSAILNADGNAVTQDFRQSVNDNNKNYCANPSRPILDMFNPEEGIAPTPLEPTWKRKVNDYYKDEVKKRVVKMLKEGGANAAALAQLLKDLKAEKKEDGSPVKDISQESLEKEGLPQFSEEEINELVDALIKGDNTSLPSDVQSALMEAAQTTADDWGLPSSWKIDSKDPVDWTPIKTDSLHPSKIEVISDNLDQFAGKMEEITKRIVDKMPPDDPQAASIMNYTKMILDAIRELKGILEEFEGVDKSSGNSEKERLIRLEDLKEAKDNILKAIEKQEAAEKAKKKHKKRGVLGKISHGFETLGKGIAGVCLIVGGGLAQVLTLGSCPQGTNLGFQLIGSKHREKATNWRSLDPNYKSHKSILSPKAPTEIEKMMQDYQLMLKQFLAQNEKAQQACEGLSQDILSMLVLLSILLKMVSGTGANSSQISGDATQAPTDSSGVISLLSGGKLSEHVDNSLEESGAIEKSSENEKLTMNMMVMMLPLILSLEMVAIGKGAINLPKEKSIGDSMNESGGKIDAAIKTIKSQTGVDQSDAIADCQSQLKVLLKLLQQLISGGGDNPELEKASENVKSSRQEVATIMKKLSEKGVTEKGLEELTAAQDKLKQSMDQLKEVLDRSIQAIHKKNTEELKEVSETTKNELVDTLKGIDNPSLPQEKIDEWLSRLSETEKNEGENPSLSKQMTQFLGEGLGESIFVGTLGLDIIKNLKRVGDEENAEKVNQLLIKLFDQIGIQFQKNLGGDAENLNQFNQAFGIAFNPSNQNLSTLGHHIAG